MEQSRWRGARALRPLAGVVLGVVAAGLLAGLALKSAEPWVKQRVEQAASEALGRETRIDAVDLRLWSLAMEVRGVTVAGASSHAEPLLTFTALRADLSWASLWHLAPVLNAVQWVEPRVHLAHRGGGRWDLDDVLQRLQAPRPDAKATGLPRFSVHNLEIQQGRIDVDDQGVKHAVTELAFHLPFVSTLDSAREVKLTPHLSMLLDGAALSADGQGQPFSPERPGQLALRLYRFDLAALKPYASRDWPLRPSAGWLGADLRLDFEQAAQGPQLILGGKLSVKDAVLADSRSPRALAWEALEVELGDTRPLARQVDLRRLSLRGLRAGAQRLSDGGLRWPGWRPSPVAAAPHSLAAVAVPAASAAPASATASAVALPADASRMEATSEAAPSPGLTVPPSRPAHGGTASGGWRFSVSEVQVDDARLRWSDAALPRPVDYVLSLDQVAVGDLSWPVQRQTRTQGQLTVRSERSDGPAARLSWKGEGGPQQAGARLDLQALPLALVQPYLPGGGTLTLAGQASAQVDLAMKAGQWRVGHGDLTVNELALRDGRQPWLRADKWQVRGLSIDPATRSVQVEQVTAQAPWAALTRDKGGRWMYERWLNPPLASASVPGKASPSMASMPTLTTPPGTPSVTPPAWQASVGVVDLRDGGVQYEDLSRSQPVRVALSRLRLSARHLATASSQPTDIHLAAAVAASGAEDRVASAVDPASAGGAVPATGTRRSAPGAATGAPAAVTKSAGRNPSFAKSRRPDMPSDRALEPEADAPGAGLSSLVFKGQWVSRPMAVQGQLTLSRLPAHALAPYGDEWLNAELSRAFASYRGRVGWQAEPGRIQINGDAALEDVRLTRTNELPLLASSAQAASAIVEAANERRIASWRSLNLRGLAVDLPTRSRGAIEVQEMALSDFFARIVVSPEGQLNLQHLVKARSASPASSSTAAVTPDTGPAIRIGPSSLINGRVRFIDHFIRPNYAADLTELTGRLGAFANSAANAGAGPSDMAALALAGRVQGTGTVDVDGHLNPLAPTLAMDLHAVARDVELAPLSTYAVKYAGYSIERGKLGVDVRYQIDSAGRLDATNKVVVRQLTFGEAEADAKTSLPVKLAVALLADRHGVIDLDLPVSGSLSDPEFSIGPVLWKMVGNLVLKAVTSPFQLLSRAFAGLPPEEVSVVDFGAGSATLSSAAVKALAQVIEALSHKPEVIVTVEGKANLDAERDAYRRERLTQLVANEKRRSASTSASGVPGSPDAAAARGARAGGAPAAPVAPSEYPTWLTQVYQKSSVPKPRNLLGLVKTLPVAEMEALLMASIEVGDTEMHDLAQRRGLAVRDHLAQNGLASERLFLGAAKSAPSRDGPWRPRAELDLSFQ